MQKKKIAEIPSTKAIESSLEFVEILSHFRNYCDNIKGLEQFSSNFPKFYGYLNNFQLFFYGNFNIFLTIWRNFTIF